MLGKWRCWLVELISSWPLCSLACCMLYSIFRVLKAKLGCKNTISHNDSRNDNTWCIIIKLLIDATGNLMEVLLFNIWKNIFKYRTNCQTAKKIKINILTFIKLIRSCVFTYSNNARHRRQAVIKTSHIPNYVIPLILRQLLINNVAHLTYCYSTCDTVEHLYNQIKISWITSHCE